MNGWNWGESGLAEGLSKGQRQDWARFVQGAARKLPAPAPASSSLDLFTGGRDRTQPLGVLLEEAGDPVASLMSSVGPAKCRSDDESGCQDSLFAPAPGILEAWVASSLGRGLGCLSTGRPSSAFSAGPPAQSSRPHS